MAESIPERNIAISRAILFSEVYPNEVVRMFRFAKVFMYQPATFLYTINILIIRMI